MSLRFYIAPMQGDGSIENPWRSILNDFIDVHSGDWFQDIDHPGRRISMALLSAPDVTHSTIAADSRVVVASPLFADKADMLSKVQNLVNAFPNIAAVKTRLENHGINTEWVTASNTFRELLSYLVKSFFFAQIASGERADQVKQFLSQYPLSTQVKDVPQAVRNAVSTWMQGKGLAVGWINANTTVREVAHFVLTNLGIGRARFMDEEF